MKILLVDAGNTSITMGFASSEKRIPTARLAGHESTPDAITQLARGLCGDRCPAGVIISSVVPSLTPVLKSALALLVETEPLVLTHRTCSGIRIRYPKPEKIGSDRLANAVGAVHGYGAPAIVADFGTALTFDVISADKAYVGGVITPGLPVMVDYLAERTALLPRIALQGRCPGVGKSTESAMRIGAKIGYRGMVREVVEHLTAHLQLEDVKLIATGGYSSWALRNSGMEFVFDPDLTLRGLLKIYQLSTRSYLDS